MMWSRMGALCLLLALGGCDGEDTKNGETDEPGDTDTDTDTSPPVDDTDDSDDTPAPDDTDETDPVDTDPDDTDRPETDTPDTDPVDTDVVDTDPVDTDPVDTDVVDTDPVDTDPVDTDPADTDSDETGDTAPDGPSVADVVTGLVAPGTLVTFDDLVLTAVLPNDMAAFSAPAGGPDSAVLVKVPPGLGSSALERVAELTGEVYEEVTGGVVRWRIDTTAAGGSFFLTQYFDPPVPYLVDAPVLADPAQALRFEGAVVWMDDPRVWDTVGTRDWELGAPPELAYVSGLQYWPGSMTYGDVFDELYGIVRWDGARWTLMPRRAADVAGLQAFQTPADTLAPGAVILSEWMVEGTTGPGGVSCTAAATRGEYVEIANTSVDVVDIDGLYVFDLLDNEFYQVRASVLLAPGERVAAWSSPTPCYGVSGGVAVGFSYRSGFNPPWAGLFNDFDALDLVSLSAFSWTPGTALELSESSLDAAANDQPSAWCDAASVIGGSADLGTPGAVNDCL